jgi:phosphatidate cytidylyltransferase
VNAAQAAGRWGDLRARVGSAVVMVALGGAAIWVGGIWFAALVVAVTGLMVWELALMSAPMRPREAKVLGLVAALSLAAVLLTPLVTGLLLLAIPVVLGGLRPRRDLLLFMAYTMIIMLTGFGLVALREGIGLNVILWLLAVVIASDLAGYFAGRSLGGPKFWPAISPKKTWSGTIAGWIGAAMVGLGFVLAGQAGWVLVAISPLVGFAGQMGDIAESWIKRRAGVKDSSNLIPGHGGVLDRFDALAGAVVMVLLLALLRLLPQLGG